MRFFNRFRNRGFTLVELMIVVAIIGVLAALAIYGVRRYLASAKTSEAKNSIGAIARGSVGAFERETTSATIIPQGQAGSAFSHDVCDDAEAVPLDPTFIQGKKYQALQGDGLDYESGTESSGWKCLKFNMSSPQYYSYSYVGNRRGIDLGAQGEPLNVGLGTQASAPSPGFAAYATGDLDGDGRFSGFAQLGIIDTNQSLTLAPQVFILDEYE